MGEFLRKYWFVCLIALAMVGILVYYVADLNKDNVSAKSVDGQDVVASTTLGDVTSQQIYDRYQSFNQTLLYNLYRNAVVDQSIEADSTLKDQAKTMEKAIEANMDSDASGKTRFSITSELAGYGFEGENALHDYCITALKTRALTRQYIADYFDEMKDVLTTNPRLVSITTIALDSTEMSDADKEKQASIDEALSNGTTFAEIATAYSDDATTAANKGFFGYIDSTSSALPSEVVQAALALDKDGTSDWLTVTDSQSGAVTMYLVHVDETDMKTIFEYDNDEVKEAVLSAFMQADQSLEAKMVKENAAKLEITFNDTDVQKKVEDEINKSLKEGE